MPCISVHRLEFSNILLNLLCVVGPFANVAKPQPIKPDKPQPQSPNETDEAEL